MSRYFHFTNSLSNSLRIIFDNSGLRGESEEKSNRKSVNKSQFLQSQSQIHLKQSQFSFKSFGK